MVATAATVISAPDDSSDPSVGGPLPLDELTPAQLAGIRTIWSYPGLEPPLELFDAIEAGEVGGVIFFGENIDPNNPAQIQQVIQELNTANEQSPVGAPLLLMTDQEGGEVARLPGQPVLSAKRVGGGPRAIELARQAGRGAAQTLEGAGMNVNLAPVLGVYREPLDFLDEFQRSFGHNAVRVAALGTTFLAAQQAEGVAATAKHFPGLGAASQEQNTDEGPVTLDLSLAELNLKDDIPYPPAIAAGVELVMTSWAVYPALDPEWPAGLSRKIVKKRLRGQYGFGGVTITDAMEAGAIAGVGTADENTVRAAKIGMDVLLYSSRTVAQGQAAVDALAAALENGDLDEAKFLEAAARVLALRQQYG